MNKDQQNTEQQQEEITTLSQNNQETEGQENSLKEDEQNNSQNNNQNKQIQINYNCVLMPEYKTADYSNLESIKEVFTPLKNINNKNFTLPSEDNAIFLKLSSVNKDHLHKAAKYGVWTSKLNQNNEIEKHYQQQLANPSIRIYIYFFFNNSLFGMAELKSGFNPTKSFQLWQEDYKWFGTFELEWIFVGQVEVPVNQIILKGNQKQIDLTYESGLKILEYARESDFNTIFNDFLQYDEKELELREKRVNNEEYYQKFCQLHSQFEHRYVNGHYNENSYKKNKYQNYQNKGQNNYDNRKDQYKKNQNNNFYNNYNNNKYKNNQNQNFLAMQQQQQQFQYMFPFIDQTQFQKFMESQPPMFMKPNQGYMKPYKKYYNNNNQNNGNYQKGYQNYKYQNNQQNNYQEDQSNQQQIENQDVNQLNQEKNELNTGEQNDQIQNNNEANNTGFNTYNNTGPYQNNYNYNNYNPNFYQNKQQYNKNQNYQNPNYGGYNNNYNKQGKYNNYNNQRGNYRNYNNNNNNNNQHRQFRQNYNNNNQNQGYQSNNNDFPHLDQLSQLNMKADNYQQNKDIVEKQLNDLSLNQQQ